MSDAPERFYLTPTDKWGLIPSPDFSEGAVEYVRADLARVSTGPEDATCEWEDWWAKNHPFDWWTKERGESLPHQDRTLVRNLCQRAFEAGKKVN
jgi:hypothetical protein